MHMADALVSPAVGATMWAASAGLLAYCAKKVRTDSDERKVPLMGVTGAFVFAAQMINFTIPATGSSGHLGGGIILAVLLGPHAAFLTIASVLTVQALFFADGGLLALGCNIFNMGFYPAFVAYPFIYRKMVGGKPSNGRIIAASLIASIAALQLGAFSVVLQTLFSGISELHFGQFLFLMQPIHLAIGIVEGAATAAVVLFVFKARPEILEAVSARHALAAVSTKRVMVALLCAAVATGAVLSWFASSHPDGLEWSIFGVTRTEQLSSSPKRLHRSLADVQEKTAFLPDYAFKAKESESEAQEPESHWPSVDAGTTVSGLVGGGLTLMLAALIGLALRRRPKSL